MADRVLLREVTPDERLVDDGHGLRRRVVSGREEATTPERNTKRLPVRTAYADSDDPVDGSGNGPDGLFDRVEILYDPNSNPVCMVDQHQVVVTQTFDPADRLTAQEISRPAAVPGTTRQAFAYDAIDRLIRSQRASITRTIRSPA